MQTARNVAIIALLALGVYAIPGGGTAADTALTALTMGFLAAIGFFVYRLYRENQLTLMTLTDARRAVLYGAFGVVALMVAGTDELLSSGAGTGSQGKAYLFVKVGGEVSGVPYFDAGARPLPGFVAEPCFSF